MKFEEEFKICEEFYNNDDIGKLGEYSRIRYCDFLIMPRPKGIDLSVVIYYFYYKLHEMTYNDNEIWNAIEDYIDVYKPPEIKG